MKDFLVLDGPIGTELIARGYAPDPVLWTAKAALEAPELLRAIHLEYARAGANIITANTFRTSAYAGTKAGLTLAETRKLCHASLAIATEVLEDVADGSSPRFLAGSLAPLEDCYKPWLVKDLATLEASHLETARWLVEGGCHVVLAETMGTTREAVVAVRAARKAGADAVAVSFITDATGQKLLGGDRLSDAAMQCLHSGAETVLVNCVHPDVIELALPNLRKVAEVGAVIGAYANSARMRLELNGDVVWEEDSRPLEVRSKDYAVRALGWLGAHRVGIIGACCGMGPAYIQEITNAIEASVGTVRK